MKEFPIITEITPEVLHGAMDRHADNIAMAFADWLIETNFGEKQTWGRHNPPSYPTTLQLYNIFKSELLCKNVNQDASVNSIQKPENQK